MNTKVSYGALAPAMIGGLGVVVNALLAKARRGESPVSLKCLPDVIEFSDSGIWGDNSLDPDVEPRVFRVSDFDGDFRLDYKSAPARAIPADKLAKFRLQCGDILVVKSSGSANQVVSGRVAVFDTDSKQAYAASNFTLRLRPKAEIDPHYLAFVLGSPPVRELVADSVKTMTYPNLSFRIYSAVEVPVIPLRDQKLVGAFFNALLNKKELPALPRYLAEQRRVVARIEELAAQIHEVRTLRHQAAKEAEALILSALTHLHLPFGTHTKPIAECSRMSTGTTPPSDRSDFYGGPIQWYTPGDLADQRRIVAELDALQAEVDALKRLQAETAAELDALLPSILDKAFRGELS